MVPKLWWYSWSYCLYKSQHIPMVLQQITTHNFICSVSEFTSSTDSIHMFPYMNSPDSVNKFGVSTRVYHEITSFSHDDTYQWNVPILAQYDSCQTRSKLVATGRTCEYIWKHVLVERYQLWTSMTHANWFRNGSLFAGMPSNLFFITFYHLKSDMSIVKCITQFFWLNTCSK